MHNKSLSIAHGLKRKAKKMADGGQVKAQPTPPPVEKAQASMRDAFHFGQSCPSCGYADGGEVGVHKSDMEMNHPANKTEKKWAGESTAGRHLSETDMYGSDSMKKVKGQHHRVLGEMKAQPNPKLKGLAMGGELESGYEEMPKAHDMENEAALKEDEEMDVVDRIMSKSYSKGGKVSNEGMDNSFKYETPNEFDDLVLDDDLEFSYDGANSGDELGNKSEDHDRSDVIDRILKSRRKKDRMPNPA